jgi:hypothetical protein
VTTNQITGVPQFVADGSLSTHGHERNRLVRLVDGSSYALRIKDGIIIHQKPILVVAVPQQHFDVPPSILTTAHGVGSWIPRIEIAHQINRLCRRGDAIEIDRLDRSFCHKRVGAAFIKHSLHNWNDVKPVAATRLQYGTTLAWRTLNLLETMA